MVTENPGQAKGAKRANEVRQAKTRGVIFFLRCLNAGAVITEFYRNYHFKHLPYDYRHKIVRAFEKLPQPRDAFYEMMNSYRAMKVMEILGENVNRGNLKEFSRRSHSTSLVKQDSKECQDMLSVIKANKKQY